ncbi:hypothetical protein BCR36DRAFT_373552 [Piromyces finnis]|uniref:Uncharacterized protein n=1 Tax=Piromyces finnis TaxID=1754191 RepID=A0A1Y1V1F5_9FUNG|nr:hypothetical protein BCR36DRAFT_373552 [Piromyces finnis]|eukprot:ORX43898.1 hypothetical protein BCR36DRAFT_373552 [Piromyces finnis]
MGFFSKCLCCCYLSEEKFVHGYFLRYFIYVLCSFISIAASISLALLLYGIKSKNEKYMRQYIIIVFGICVILQILPVSLRIYSNKQILENPNNYVDIIKFRLPHNYQKIILKLKQNSLMKLKLKLQE